MLKNRYKKIIRLPSNESAGATLIEMLVYTFLFGLIFTGIYLIFNASVKFYYVTQSNVWVQHSSMNAINEISREVAESKLKLIYLYGPTSSYPGIVFMSPREIDGTTIVYNSSGDYIGQPKWQKYICYYVGDDPADSSKKVIFRKETKTDLGLDIPTGPYTIPYTTANFAGDTGAIATYPPKIVAHNIKPYDAGDSEHSGFHIYYLNSSGVETYGTPSASSIYIRITAQESNDINKTNTITTTSSMEALNNN